VDLRVVFVATDLQPAASARGASVIPPPASN